MNVWTRAQRFEGMVFGFVVGVVVALLGSAAWHQATGLLHVSAWRRAVETQNLPRIAELLEQEVALAEQAMADGRPLPASEHLAFELMPRLYRHQMEYAVDLLRRGESDRFNELGAATPFVLLDLSERDLSGLDLTGAKLDGAALVRTDLSGCDLTGASFLQADLPGAVLTGARVGGARFTLANLAGATLNGVAGERTDFRQAVLAGASMTTVHDLVGARFDGAILSEANLWRSRFPQAVFDTAELTMASAVEADLSEVASMIAADLTGANLGGARLSPAAMARSWLSGAEGLDAVSVLELRRHGAVLETDEVLRLVDPRIVDGFRAQVDEDDAIPAERKAAMVLYLLKGYYVR